jgi:ADP-ribose pyrophosphatase YjhB (NUDIX family)
MRIMTRKYYKFISASHLFLVKGNKILLLKRENTGYEDGNFSVIAGHINGGESIKKAMIREAKEEGGIDINSRHLKLVHVMHRRAADGERIDWFFMVKKWNGKLINNEPYKCSRLAWFALHKLPPNVVPYVRAAISNFIKGINYSEFGWSKNYGK